MNKERQGHVDELVQRSIHSKREPLSRRRRFERAVLLTAGLFSATMGIDRALSLTHKIDGMNPVNEKLVNKPEVNGVPEVSPGEISVTNENNLVTVAIGVEDSPAIRKAFYIQSQSNSNYKVTLQANNFTTDGGQISFPQMSGSIGEKSTTTKVSNGSSAKIASEQSSYVLVFTGGNSENSVNLQDEAQKTGISGEYAISITNNNTGNSKNLTKEAFQTN